MKNDMKKRILSAQLVLILLMNLKVSLVQAKQLK